MVLRVCVCGAKSRPVQSSFFGEVSATRPTDQPHRDGHVAASGDRAIERRHRRSGVVQLRFKLTGATIGDLKAAAKPSVAAVEIIGTADMHDGHCGSGHQDDRRVRCAVACFTLHWSAPPRLPPAPASPRRVAKASRGMDGGGGDGTSRSDVANAISRATQRSEAHDSSASSLNRLPRKPSSAQLGGGGGGGAIAAASGVRSSSAGQWRRGTLGPSSSVARRVPPHVRSRSAWRRARGREEAGRGGGERVAEAAKRRSEEERKRLETRIAAEKGGSGGGVRLTEKERVAAERAAAAAPRSARWRGAVRDAEIARENAGGSRRRSARRRR